MIVLRIHPWVPITHWLPLRISLCTTIANDREPLSNQIPPLQPVVPITNCFRFGHLSLPGSYQPCSTTAPDYTTNSPNGRFYQRTEPNMQEALLKSQLLLQLRRHSATNQHEHSTARRDEAATSGTGHGCSACRRIQTYESFWPRSNASPPRQRVGHAERPPQADRHFPSAKWLGKNHACNAEAGVTARL